MWFLYIICGFVLSLSSHQLINVVHNNFYFPRQWRISISVVSKTFQCFFLPKKIVGKVPTVRKGFIKELTATKLKRKVQQEA